MGVDNNGRLFLGLMQKEVDLSKIPGLDMKILEEDGLGEALESVSRKPATKGLCSQDDSGYERNKTLVGYLLADSGSYGLKKIDDLPSKIAESTKKFVEIFGIEPNIYILNYQW